MAVCVVVATVKRADNIIMGGDGLKKCCFPAGVTIRPDGVNELDPCRYREVERYKNVTVRVLRCTRCGHTEVTWVRQEDTERLEAEN